MQLTGESQTLELASTPESISVVERMIDDIRNKYNAVSYTHLDVYKRQLLLLKIEPNFLFMRFPTPLEEK